MGLHIVTGQVDEVFVAGEWHTVVDGSFRLDAYEYADLTAHEFAQDDSEPVLYGNLGHGFEFVTSGGHVLAGPLASIVAVRQKTPPGPAKTQLEELAQLLGGEVDSQSSSVRFTFADEQFEMWQGAAGWTYSLTGDRELGSSNLGFSKWDSLRTVVNAVMSELKAGMRPGTVKTAIADAIAIAAPRKEETPT